MGYGGDERREHFRVYDNLIIEYRIVSEAMTHRPIGAHVFASSSAPVLMRELRDMSLSCERVLEPLSARDPEVGNLGRLLSRRLDILTELVAAAHEVEGYVDSRPVTLSEGGLSFRNAASLPVGTHLAMKLTFIPSHQTLRLYSRVAQSNFVEPEDQQPHDIGVEFVKLTETERATIARYVVQKQVESRRVMEDSPSSL